MILKCFTKPLKIYLTTIHYEITDDVLKDYSKSMDRNQIVS